MPKIRKGIKKKLKPKLHTFCEGEKTEPLYLRGYLNHFHSNNRLLQVIKIEKTNKNTPVQLVEEAIKLQNSKKTPDNDVFWVAYDRESKSKYSDGLHGKAIALANSNNINVAISSVCFEIWILLHFVESCAAHISYSDLIKNSKLKTDLKLIGVQDYDKADERIFDLICDRIDEAKARAEKMNNNTIQCSNHNPSTPYKLNPYTAVHKLLGSIDAFVLGNQ